MIKPASRARDGPAAAIAGALLRVLALAPFAAMPSPAAADTPLSGPMPPLLTLAQSPYVVTGDLTLDGGSTTAEPGVELRFQSGRIVLRNSNTLHFVGTPTQPIRLRGDASVVWGGIGLRTDTSSDAITAHHTFEWVVFENATRAYDVSYFQPGSRVTFRNCQVHASGSRGIRIGNLMPTPRTVWMDNVDVDGAADVGIELGGASFDSIQVAHCDAVSCGTGFRLTGDAIMASNLTAAGNLVGFDVTGSPQVSLSRTMNNACGLQVDLAVPTTLATFHKVAVIANTQSGVVILPAGKAKFDSCSFHDNFGYDVRAESSIMTTPSLDFRRCYWGGPTTSEMIDEGTFSDIAAIYDWWEDGSRSQVDYSGFLLGEPVVDAAVLPEANVVALQTSCPNPFRSVTRINYVVPRAGLVTLRVFDAAGRLVRMLDESDRGAGRYSVSWDGRSTAGEETAAGVYFCRLDVQGAQATQKLVRIP